MMKQIFRKMTYVALLAAMIFGTLATVYAADISTKKVTESTYYDSGCLKSVTVEVKASANDAAAYGRIAVHSSQTSYSSENKYSADGSKWPTISDSTLVALSSGDEFQWTDGKAHTVTIKFADREVPGDKDHTYQVYLWTRSESDGVYPEAKLGELKTSDSGSVTFNGNEVKHEHNYSDDYTVDKEASCTEAGSKSRHCMVAGCTEKTDITEIPAFGHTEVIDSEEVEPTCTEPGTTAAVHCAACSAVLQKAEPIPATGHTEVIDTEAVAATCTEPGKTEASHCSACDEVLKVAEPIPATGHTEVVDKAVAATCTKTGLTEGSHCSVCNTVIKKQETVPATGHTAVTDKAVAATCTKTGLTEGSHCSVCNEVIKKQETVPATGHTAVTDKAVAATCTKTGLTEGSHCSVCNEVIKKQETVPATGHKYPDKWTVTKKATATKKGLEVKKCLNGCGNTIEKEIAATGTKSTTTKTTTTTKKVTSPKTGDSSGVWFWLSAALLSLICIMGLIREFRHSKSKN